jgi:membrane protein implicated in regulation of membrane protease activity
MLTIYWACLLGGLTFTLLALFVGDLLEGVLDAFDGLDAFLDPLSFLAGVTAFGGAGVILDVSTGLGSGATAVLAAGLGLALAVVMHFVYVRPMRESENSMGFSVQDYRGKIGEVLTTVPSNGYGEVLITIGHSNTFRDAASFHNIEIPSGTRIVVVDVRDGDLLVAPFEEEALPLAPVRPSLPEATPSIN